MITTPRVITGSTSSGCGKTTITTGIMAALSSTQTVQGYKVGPDYIDPGYHTAATGRISRNLDTWMIPKARVLELFARTQTGADIAVIEGVMGLYDGYDGLTEHGSTAEVAKLLKSPVILIIDVKKMARSAGALALGYSSFDPELKMAGVIINNVASRKHEQWVREAVESIGLPVIGAIPKLPDLNVPERHLGLLTTTGHEEKTYQFIDNAKQAVQKYVDLEQIRAIASQAAAIKHTDSKVRKSNYQKVKVAVARDEAFCFYYEDNLDLLRECGAEIVFFSPLHDECLPQDVHGLYLGGGYPELYAKALSSNAAMNQSLKNAITDGLPAYAECGGFMVLTQTMIDMAGIKHPMLGLIPGYTRMIDRLTMGYREVVPLEDNCLSNQGDVMRGHEFHYSEWVLEHNDIPFAYQVTPRGNEAVRQEGYSHKNILASYIHVHFEAMPEGCSRFINKCSIYKDRKIG